MVKMSLHRRFISILYVILTCVVCGGLLLLSSENARTQTDNSPRAELSATIPVNPSLVHDNRDIKFGDFAWQTFVALNWPADCQTGLPSQEQIGQAHDKARVWEFYHFPEDVFQSDGEKPELQPIVPPQCLGFNGNQSVDQDLRLTEFASEPTIESEKLKSTDHLHIFSRGQEPLIDRAGNYILNEIRMNPVEVNQIVDSGWYSDKNLQGFNNTDNLFQLACSAKEPNGTFPQTPDHLNVPCKVNTWMGAIEIKASWMVLPDSKVLPDGSSAPDKYYTTKRTFNVTTPENKTEKTTVPVALVGFHIMQKTSQQGWIWATFEHNNNAPDNASLPASRDQKHYNLYSSECTENCQVNTPYVKKPYLWRQDFPHAVTTTVTGVEEQTPSQITRLVSIPKFAQSLNEKWQKKLATSVWRNYQLIGVQWLENPYDPYNLAEVGGRGVTPLRLANVTLEPYVQIDEKGNSCITCHTLAKLRDKKTYADFSFLLLPNQDNFNQ